MNRISAVQGHPLAQMYIYDVIPHLPLKKRWLKGDLTTDF